MGMQPETDDLPTTAETQVAEAIVTTGKSPLELKQEELEKLRRKAVKYYGDDDFKEELDDINERIEELQGEIAEFEKPAGGVDGLSEEEKQKQAKERLNEKFGEFSQAVIDEDFVEIERLLGAKLNGGEKPEVAEGGSLKLDSATTLLIAETIKEAIAKLDIKPNTGNRETAEVEVDGVEAFIVKSQEHFISGETNPFENIKPEDKEKFKELLEIVGEERVIYLGKELGVEIKLLINHCDKEFYEFIRDLEGEKLELILNDKKMVSLFTIRNLSSNNTPKSNKLILDKILKLDNVDIEKLIKNGENLDKRTVLQGILTKLNVEDIQKILKLNNLKDFLNIYYKNTTFVDLIDEEVTLDKILGLGGRELISFTDMFKATNMKVGRFGGGRKYSSDKLKDYILDNSGN